jgi:hypothetical protein
MQLTLDWQSFPTSQSFPPTSSTLRQDFISRRTRRLPLSRPLLWLSQINKAVVAKLAWADRAVALDNSSLRDHPQSQESPTYQLILGDENMPPLNSLATSAGNGGTGRLIARDQRPVCLHLRIPARPTQAGSQRNHTSCQIGL